jgi:hypothetical protein
MAGVFLIVGSIVFLVERKRRKERRENAEVQETRTVQFIDNNKNK